jgi:hypothetical protein
MTAVQGCSRRESRRAHFASFGKLDLAGGRIERVNLSRKLHVSIQRCVHLAHARFLSSDGLRFHSSGLIFRRSGRKPAPSDRNRRIGDSANGGVGGEWASGLVPYFCRHSHRRYYASSHPESSARNASDREKSRAGADGKQLLDGKSRQSILY